MEYLTKFFSSIKNNVILVVNAEDELVDPQVVLREECDKAHCVALKEKLQQCNDRVNSRKKTSEICAEELYDWLHCVDHCVAKTLFTKLK